MKFRTLTLAAGAVLLSAGVASAAVITNDLNLRSGPGTGYGVIDTMPAGASVNVIGCTGGWCRVDWHGAVGYASASYLGGGGGYAVAPVYSAPVYYDEPYFAGPSIGFGFRFGGGHRGWHGGHRGGWHHHGGGHHHH